MFHTFHTIAGSLGDAAVERVVLLLNHVLAAETVATDRLRPHVGRRLSVELANWPSLLPAAPALSFVITPAGLLERADPAASVETPADLHVRVDMSNPALALLQSLSGDRPTVDVTGDARLAADVSWLFDNLRWDIEDDLARVVGQVPARELARFGGFLAAGLRQAVRLGVSVAGRAGAGRAFDGDHPAR